jgi:phage shock protein E
MITFLKNLFSTTNYKQLVKDGALVIDVRTGPEFDAEHLPMAKHIPLDRIAVRAAQLKAENKPIIIYCASGVRSGAACSILRKHGVTCYNGGSWKGLGKKLGLL